MASSPDRAFEAYLADAPGFARPILAHLRRVVREACPVTEAVKWGHPSFLLEGKLFCSMAAFKAHCTFGFWHQEMEKIVAKGRGTTDGAAGLFGRITRLADLPPERVLRSYLRSALALHAAGGPIRPRPKKNKKPEAKVPADLASALATSPRAAAVFAKFSPSHRREYIEWIEEAKRAETRQKRLATTLDWLASGKSRNWKYVAC